MKINEVVNLSIFLEMDPSRRGFLKKLGKGALGIVATAIASMVPQKAMAMLFNNKSDCQKLWQFAFDSMEMLRAGASVQDTKNALLKRFVRSLEDSKSKNIDFAWVVDIANDVKDTVHYTPYNYAEEVYKSCLKG